MHINIRRRALAATLCLTYALAYAGDGQAAGQVTGQVVDLNGRALSQAMVTLSKPPETSGPTAVTVFTDASGRFEFPVAQTTGTPHAQMLGYSMLDPVPQQGTEFLIIMKPQANQAGVAPASAWLKDIADPTDRVAMMMRCVACHQVPAPEVRKYASMIHDVPSPNPEVSLTQSWFAISQYMNYLSAWEISRGFHSTAPVEENVYSAGDPEQTSKLLARTLTGPMREIEGYKYNAPLLVNAHTVIREYEVPRPNAIREALTLDDPSQIWAADVSTNRVIRVDANTGATRDFVIPTKLTLGPHTLRRAKDGSLWIAPLFNGVVSRLDPKTEAWSLWTLAPVKGMPAGVHDLTVDVNYDIMEDKQGRVWYSDIVNNAVGYLDPKTGKSNYYPIPPVPGRVGNENVYGIVMSSDRVHIWYAQLGNGCFGSFNTQTLKFETVVQLPNANSGPRRIAMSERDVLYVALYGEGQVAEYDTRANKMIGVYDLPDRASAPYAVTWDPLRHVLWVATSNANAIYRFDPRDKSFAVLPLPREGAFLRMLAVDKHTGALVTSYGNIVESVRGPRMVVSIDPGDGVTGKSARINSRKVSP
jgi:streptogramin lyase